MSTNTRLRLARTPAALLCACVLLAACQDGVVAPADPPPVAASLSDPLAQRLAQMGFRPDMIVDAGDHFVVEGDILFRKADLAGAPRMNVEAAGGPQFHYHTTSLVPQSMMAQGIPVNLSGITSNSAWTTAARSAIWQWNNSANTKIKFVEVTSGAYINFSFRTSSSTAGIAQGGFPVNGYPGGAVIINPYYNSLSATRKLQVMVHELGHTMGHRHTNWATVDPSGGTEGAVWIPGTPTGSESASVMNSVIHDWNGFTANDAIANRYLYPAEDFSLTLEDYVSGHPRMQWAAVPHASSYVIVYNYYMDEFIYEPTFPEGGYWSWVQYTEQRGSTTGTSFTDTGKTYTGSDACGAIYEVQAVYPSGRGGGRAVSQGYLVC